MGNVIALLDCDGVDFVRRFECQRCHKVEEYTDGDAMPTGWLLLAWQQVNATYDAKQKIICTECSEYFGVFIEGFNVEDSDEDEKDTLESETLSVGTVY